MQKLMIKAQDKAKEIRHLQDTVLPKLKQQLADTKGIFKGKERKALTEQIQRTEKEIAEKLDKLPDVLKEDGYPDVQAYMATYRKAEAVVEQFNRDLAAWEQQVREKQKPAKKEQAKPPERESVLKRLRQLQAEGKQRNQPRQRKKSFDRDRRYGITHAAAYIKILFVFCKRDFHILSIDACFLFALRTVEREVS